MEKIVCTPAPRDQILRMIASMPARQRRAYRAAVQRITSRKPTA
tara:strand:+ start:1329 stop:1460 length:132 start_codon:yes stop_codon:yes gene_type:complete